MILKANSAGELLLLKDVGKVELHLLWHDRVLKPDERPWAAIVLTPLAGSSEVKALAEVKKKLRELKEMSFPPDMTFDVSDQFLFSLKGVRRP